MNLVEIQESECKMKIVGSPQMQDYFRSKTAHIDPRIYRHNHVTNFVFDHNDQQTISLKAPRELDNCLLETHKYLKRYFDVGQTATMIGPSMVASINEINLI